MHAIFVIFCFLLIAKPFLDGVNDSNRKAYGDESIKKDFATSKQPEQIPGLDWKKKMEEEQYSALLDDIKAAQQGDAPAQYILGLYYENGKGVKQDISKAVNWYRKAAEQGYALAQYELGLCYEKGKGVEQDFAEAMIWYRKSAEQGNETAQNVLKLLAD